MPKRLSSRVLRGLDALFPLAMVLFMLSLAEWATQNGPHPQRMSGLAAAVLAGGALYWRRTNPGWAMLVCAAASAVYQILAPEGLFPYAALVALWAFTARRPVYWSLPALAAVIGVTLLAAPSQLFPRDDLDFAVIVAVVVWALSWAMRSHRQAIEQAAARAAMEEESRLARDIHDVIAHSVSVIVVQAAAADDVFDTRPDRAREALRSIEATGRDALAELRALLSHPSRDNRLGADAATHHPATSAAVPARPFLHELLSRKHLAHVEPEPHPQAGELRPQPTLDRLRPDVIAPLEAAGLDIGLAIDGEITGLSRGIQLTSFRIVQESLTNVLRHGRGAGAKVELRVGKRELTVRVENVGPGTGAPRPVGFLGVGRGIVGMRERASLVGGVLEAGPTDGNGFRVVARLPVNATVRP